MKGRVVHVDIHDQRYAVRSELDPSYIIELAAFVDERMRSASSALDTPDSLRIAVIAALNIADELFRARADGQGAEGHLQARFADIERLVDSALRTARERAVNE